MFPTLPLRHLVGVAMLCAVAGPALAAEPLVAKSATLQCAERRIDLKADCFTFVGRLTACTRQTLHFSGADGKALGKRVFTPKPLEEGDDYPMIEEKVDSLSCVATADKQTVVVAAMYNGGNCAQCEWTDVYSVDGVLLGTNRDRKNKSPVVSAALAAMKEKETTRVLQRNALTDFYKVSTSR